MFLVFVLFVCSFVWLVGCLVGLIWYVVSLVGLVWFGLVLFCFVACLFVLFCCLFVCLLACLLHCLLCLLVSFLCFFVSFYLFACLFVCLFVCLCASVCRCVCASVCLLLCMCACVRVSCSVVTWAHCVGDFVMTCYDSCRFIGTQRGGGAHADLFGTSLGESLARGVSRRVGKQAEVELWLAPLRRQVCLDPSFRNRNRPHIWHTWNAGWRLIPACSPFCESCELSGSHLCDPGKCIKGAGWTFLTCGAESVDFGADDVQSAPGADFFFWGGAGTHYHQGRCWPCVDHCNLASIPTWRCSF